jgi:5-methylcytosine-specific restriction endonuclease McrA
MQGGIGPKELARQVVAGLRQRRAAAARAKRNRRDGTRCFYCGRAFDGDRTIDHRVPRSLGGTEGLANLVFACRSCNRRKADMPEDEFTASEWLRRRAADAGRRDVP